MQRMETTLVSVSLQDSLLEARMELALILHDQPHDVWRAYGVFPGGTDEHRISSPVGNGRSPDAAVEALLGMTVAHRAWGVRTALWALGEAVDGLTREFRHGA
jgi:hypothetical protein